MRWNAVIRLAVHRFYFRQMLREKNTGAGGGSAAARQSSLRESRVGLWFAPPPAERGQICNSVCRSTQSGNARCTRPMHTPIAPHACVPSTEPLPVRRPRHWPASPSVAHGTGPPPINVPSSPGSPQAAQLCLGARVSCRTATCAPRAVYALRAPPRAMTSARVQRCGRVGGRPIGVLYDVTRELTD